MPMFKSVTNKLVMSMLQSIEKNDPNMTHAIFESQILGDEQIAMLARSLPKNTYLQYLNLLDCNLLDEHLCVLLPALKANTSLKMISIELPNNHPNPKLQAIILDMQTMINARNNDSYKGTIIA